MALSTADRVQIIVLGLTSGLIGAAAHGTPALAQISVNPAFVRLQATTPGTAQSGHANVTGTLIAGQFQGGGAAVTGVNAAMLGGSLPTEFGKLITANAWTGPNTFIGNSNGTGTMMTVHNTNPTGIMHAIKATSDSGTSLVAIQGLNAPGVVTSGIQGYSESGIGVIGETRSSSEAAAQAQNLTTGNIVTLCSGQGAINTDGFLRREYTSISRSVAIPIAYGTVNTSGSILGGTQNFSVSRTVAGEYDITVNGESYSNASFVVTITPVSGSDRHATVIDSGDSFRALIFSNGGALTDTQFQFTVWTNSPANSG